MRLIPSWAAVIFAPCSSNLGKTAAEFEMQLQLREFQQTCPCLGQVAPNFLQMQRCTKTPTEEAAPKKTPKEEAAPKRESFTKSLQTSPCVLVSVQETNNFPISANSVTILKRPREMAISQFLTFNCPSLSSISPHKLCPDPWDATAPGVHGNRQEKPLRVNFSQSLKVKVRGRPRTGGRMGEMHL